MAYTRLLRAYYRTERAIPDTQKYRLARAVSRAQRMAVDAVLAEFFEMQADGWHQKRCDEEIEAYREDAGELEAKKENERERQRRHRERRKQLFDALRECGVVPKWDTSIDDLETLLSREQKHTNNGDRGRDGNAPVTRTATATQKPEPEARESTRARRVSRKTPLPDDFGISERVRRWAEEKGVMNLRRHFEAFVGKCKAKDYRYVDWDEALMGAIRDDWARIGKVETESPEERFPI